MVIAAAEDRPRYQSPLQASPGWRKPSGVPNYPSVAHGPGL